MLSLLEYAAEVAGTLSEMTTAKVRRKDGRSSMVEGNEEDDDNKMKMEEREEETKSFEDLKAKVRAIGIGYLEGVKKLHRILAPHADLVKSYRNHDDSEKKPSYSLENEKQPHESLETVPATPSGSTNDNSPVSKVVEGVTSNMYAARVEKRLAMERSEILKEMIRLEELESSLDGEGSLASKNGASGPVEGSSEGWKVSFDTAGFKRKHESMEHQT